MMTSEGQMMTSEGQRLTIDMLPLKQALDQNTQSNSPMPGKEERKVNYRYMYFLGKTCKKRKKL
jgi:hypothetical protein